MSRFPAITYITADEVQEDTTIAGLNALSDANVEILIRIAESNIDAYVGPQEHHPDDDNVDRVFPRIEDLNSDGDVEIPFEVYEACLRQVEFLYVNWWDTSSSALMPMAHEVKSYSADGSGGYSEERSKGGNDHAAAALCDASKALLGRFISNSADLVLSDVSAGYAEGGSSRELI